MSRVGSEINWVVLEMSRAGLEMRMVGSEMNRGGFGRVGRAWR
jgi:hypothetical protein